MSDFNNNNYTEADECVSDADKYVNDTYQIYSSNDYIKTLKESGYTQEEIKEFLNEVKQNSRECFNSVKNQQSKILSYILDDNTNPKDNVNYTQPKNIPVNCYNLESKSDLLNSLKNKSFSNKYLLSSLSQSNYYNNMSISVNK